MCIERIDLPLALRRTSERHFAITFVTAVAVQRPLYIIGTQIHGRRFQRGLSAPNDPMPPLLRTATNGLIKP